MGLIPLVGSTLIVGSLQVGKVGLTACVLKTQIECNGPRDDNCRVVLNEPATRSRVVASGADVPETVSMHERRSSSCCICDSSVAITNYEREDNLGSTIISVRQEFYDILG